VVLQNYTFSEEVVMGPYVDTYPVSQGSNQSMKIKAEEVDPVRMTVQDIKAEPEVSCMLLCVYC
jgi:hypothetical protein